MARYIPIGSPINRAEAEGLRQLRDRLPTHFTVLGNFELQLAERRNTIEFDALVLGDRALYVVEIKGWSGPIRGDIRRWQLPWKRVESPFIRNETRAKALRALLSSRIERWPGALACESVVYLPSAKPSEITLCDARAERLLIGGEEASFFARREALGGELFNEALKARVLKELAPLSSPKHLSARIPDYHVIEDRSDPRYPYREVLAQHAVLRHRGKVRIKSYALDPLLPAATRDKTLAETLCEIEALHVLESTPYVARGYEVVRDTEEELVFHVASQWIGPRTLQDEIAEEMSSPVGELSSLARRRRFALCAELTQAVASIHERGVIHRNLTPASVAMTPPRDAGPRLKLIDFDFARVGRFRGHERHRLELLTPAYSAPELWRAGSDAEDRQVDIYSLGAILYELLCGRPFCGPTDGMLRQDELWERRRGLLPDALCERLIGAMMTQDPARRATCLNEAGALFERRASAATRRLRRLNPARVQEHAATLLG